MKKFLTFALLIGSLLSFTSCNEKAKLASAVTGSWSGSAERVDTPDAKTTTTVTRYFTFTTDAGSKTGGTLTATAQFSLESGTQLEATNTQPISVTASGTATITGKWEATDDDEIMVSFDTNSLQVNVDPQEVVLEYTISTETSEPISEDLPATMATAIKRSMTSVMAHDVFSFSKIDDIKVKGNLMSCELGHKDYTFHRDI